MGIPILHSKIKSTETFEIYSASAGSGKTYQLTKGYLALLLRPHSSQSYRYLLAITFTNKAASEMKQRILDGLFDFSLEQLPQKTRPLFDEISKTLSMSPQLLRTQSKRILKELLHNYSLFGVSTIDRFNHKLLKTFAQDLKIAQHFEVVLGDELQILLEEAIGRLLSDTGTSLELTRVLLDFSLDKIEQDKSWDIEYDLKEIGQLLFQETHHGQLNKLRGKTLKDFLGLQSKLQRQISVLQQKIRQNAAKALQLVSDEGLVHSDFYKGQFPKFMERLSEESTIVNFNAAWKQNFENTPLYPKNSDVKDNIEAIRPLLIRSFNSIKKDFYNQALLKNVLSNTIPIALLNEINKHINKIKLERDLLPISEFNTIISKEIRNQPTPFIYERLGEKYQHYFIDEFQDTSLMQWQNLIPLIGNALESENERGEKGSLFIVGDVKQAIYRWRGGSAEQFLNLMFLKENPFSLPAKTKELKTNWRSQVQIVTFNNDFFTYSAEKLLNNVYGEIYKSGNKQQHQKKGSGYVSLTFLEKDNESILQQCEHALHTIYRVLQKGYGYKDICVLVRDNKKAIVLADFLAQSDIPIISPDSLLLSNNENVCFLVAFLKCLSDLSDKNSFYEVLWFLSKSENRHDFITTYLNSTERFCQDFDVDFEQLKKKSTYSIVEWAIEHFQLADESEAYLYQFMDMIFEVETKKGNALLNVLRFWEAKKDRLAISVPENSDAVQLMTIHKAKGLEFPVVIFPFADSKIIDSRNEKIWIEMGEDTVDGFEKLLFNYNKNLAAAHQTKSAYQSEQERLELDAFNVLYVAMTRAINALFVICAKKTSKNRGQNENSYSQLFMDYLSHLGLWTDEKETYEFGHFTTNEQDKEVHKKVVAIPHLYQVPPKNLDGTTHTHKGPKNKEALLKGILFHRFMAFIKYAADEEVALNRLHSEMPLSQENENFLKQTFQKLLRHPLLKDCFNNDMVVYNEKEILHAKLGVLRPDRIHIKDETATLIDYKTGKKTDSDQKQMQGYAKALTDMGFQIDKSILIYIDKEDINPIIVQ